MKWEGSKLKELARGKRLSLQALAAAVGVSRQTINDWIKGQVPKGNHLLLLCRLLGTNPGMFFSGEPEDEISVPIHRQRMNNIRFPAMWKYHLPVPIRNRCTEYLKITQGRHF